MKMFYSAVMKKYSPGRGAHDDQEEWDSSFTTWLCWSLWPGCVTDFRSDTGEYMCGVSWCGNLKSDLSDPVKDSILTTRD